MKQNELKNISTLTRRSFLRRSAKFAGATALLSGLPKGWVGSAYADDAPETSAMKFGMIALTDCSSIVIAHEKGFFKKYGVASTVAKQASWAAVRDGLSNGDLQGTHMLITNDVDEGILLADRIIPLSAGPNATLGPSFKVDLDRPRDRKAINHCPRFKQIRRDVTDYLIGLGAKKHAEVTRRLVLPDIEPEDLSVPRPLIGGRRTPVRRKEIKNETVAIDS